MFQRKIKASQDSEKKKEKIYIRDSKDMKWSEEKIVVISIFEHVINK